MQKLIKIFDGYTWPDIIVWTKSVDGKLLGD